jgi:hypothetical protein
MIKLIDILNEIGDATNPVPYKKIGEEDNEYEKRLRYAFNIGDDVYIVNMYIGTASDIPRYDGIKKGSTVLTLWFGLKTDKDELGSTARTNKFNQYQVMATVTKILKDYINDHPELAEISYEPVKSNTNDFSREKLYKAYVRKNLPNWNYSEEAGYVYLTRPELTEPIKKRLFKK